MFLRAGFLDCGRQTRGLAAASDVREAQATATSLQDACQEPGKGSPSAPHRVPVHHAELPLPMPCLLVAGHVPGAGEELLPPHLRARPRHRQVWVLLVSSKPAVCDGRLAWLWQHMIGCPLPAGMPSVRLSSGVPHHLPTPAPLLPLSHALQA